MVGKREYIQETAIVTSMFLLIGCFNLIYFTLFNLLYLHLFTATDCELLEDRDNDLIFHGTPKADKE